MKVFTHDLAVQKQDIKLLPLGDFHIGDKQCNKAKIKELINKILNEEHTYTVLMGDLINNSTTTSVGDTYEEELPPMEQLRVIKELVKPLAQAGKILAIVEGNHEERTAKAVGLRPMELLANQLGLENVYSETTALLFLKVGQSSKGFKYIYTVYITHGHGGGKRAGSKIGSLEDNLKIVDADLFLQGHTHQPGVFKLNHFRPRTNKCSVEEVEITFVNIASTLGYNGSYADRMGLTPASNSFPEITLCGSTRYVEVKI